MRVLGARRPARTAAPPRPVATCSASTRPSPRDPRRHDREVELAAARALGLLHRVGEPHLVRPARPRRAVVGPPHRRLGDDLELHDRARLLADRLADAVGAGVAAADHDDVACPAALIGLAGRRRDRRRRAELASPPSGCARRGTPSRNGCPGSSRPSTSRSRGTRAPVASTTASNSARSSLAADVDADLDAEPQLDALLDELVDAPLDDPLLDLEVGDAEADQPAGRLVALEEHDRVAGAAQLLGGREPGRAGADDGDAAAGLEGSAAPARPSPRRRRGR